MSACAPSAISRPARRFIYGEEKYRKAIDVIRSQLETQPRTKEGNFWHKDIYPWQVWLDGTCDKYLSQNPDGSLQLGGICLVAGLGGKDHRDGSLAYYFSEPVVCNDAKGVGPLVLAYTEMIAKK